MDNKGKKPIKIDSKTSKKPIKIKKRNNTIFKIIAFLLLIIIVLAILKYKIFIPSIENIKDSVVMLEVYDSDDSLIATGSGFCAFEKNYIVTNFHVIEGGYKIKVITDDKKKYDVNKIIIFNKKDDLAIVQINGELNTLNINFDNKIKVKDKVTAIGSPKGELNTVSEGIISNIDNNNSIRISVPISHGSSGGVLLNRKNEVIGITNAGYDDAENLNFAISTKVLDLLYEDYKKNNYSIINSSNYIDCVPSILHYHSTEKLEINNKCNFSNLYTYSTNTMNDFYVTTNSFAIFNDAMTRIMTEEFNINYINLPKSDKILVSNYYTNLIDYEECRNNYETNCSFDNISLWNNEIMVINLNILKTYELAIFGVEVKKYNYNSDTLFDYINSLPLDVPQKGILLLLYGQFSPQDLNDKDVEKIIDYLKNMNLTTNELIEILTYLGFEVKNNQIYW